MFTNNKEIKKASMILGIAGMLIVAVSMLSGCGKGDTGAQGPQGIPGASAPTPTPSPTDANLADIQDVLENGAHGNLYRESQNQEDLLPGLACQVVAVASGQCLSNSTSNANVGCRGTTAGGSPGLIQTTGTTYLYQYNGAFNEPNSSSGVSNLLPTALQSYFPSPSNPNYRIICSGYIVIQQPGLVEFEVDSDDGAIITTDSGTLWNDGNHAMTSAVQPMVFTRDVHSIQVQYAQSGGGAFGLVLTLNNQQIPANLLYH